jgi:hypothetical protein
MLLRDRTFISSGKGLNLPFIRNCVSANNMRNYLIKGFQLIAVFVLAACSDDIGTIKIKRDGFLTFNINGTEWKATTFKVSEGPYVVVYVDQPNAGRPFIRYALIAQGTNPEGLIFQLSLVFDLKTKENFVGLYSTTYSVEGGGLNQIILNQETSKGSGLYTDYRLCLAQDQPAVVDIKRQSTEEKLVLGNFSGKLCLTSNESESISLSNGIFADITYDRNSNP